MLPSIEETWRSLNMVGHDPNLMMKILYLSLPCSILGGSMPWYIEPSRETYKSPKSINLYTDGRGDLGQPIAPLSIMDL